jgi:hypothetical protein
MLALACAVVLSFLAHPAIAAAPRKEPPLVTLAAAKFSNLTRAERVLLEFADKDNLNHGDFAITGSSANPLDPGNDPAHGSEWSHDRDIRAGLIRWLCVDADAARLVDPIGIRVLGARITGALNLVNVRVPFDIVLRRCAIGEPINLRLSEFANLDFGGSYTNAIDAEGVKVRGDVDMNAGFRASRPVSIVGSTIDGSIDCEDGTFTYSKSGSEDFWADQRPALSLNNSRIGGAVIVCCGFRSDGVVMAVTATMAGLFCYGGRFINPGRMTLSLDGATVTAYALLGNWAAEGKKWPGLVSDGLVLFDEAKIGAWLRVEGSRFLGKPDELHGFVAIGVSVGGVFLWLDEELQKGATLDLRSASAKVFVDDQKSWPQPGKLLLDGFTYQSLSDGYDAKPSDARTRLRWIGLQSEFNPQPYRQLASVLHARGDDAGSTLVLINEEDLRYAQYGAWWRLWGAFLKYTIGYGHRPLLAIMWSLAVVLLGWIVVRIARDAGVMRLTWPENTVPPIDPHAGLYPLLYSLDVFVPFVNLHQEHYWWPDTQSAGEAHIFGTPLRVRGSLILYYLWFQIIAGWLLSAIFVAGVTGLIRGD